MLINSRQYIYIIVLFWTVLLSGQTNLIDEQFTSGTTPSGWSNVSNGGTAGQIWEFNNSRNITAGGISGNYAILDSDGYGNGNGNSQDASLTTTTFSTVGYETITLEFDYQYRDYNGGESCVIEVFNGSTWVEVFRKEVGEENYISVSNGANFESIDITTESGNAANTQVRFTYNGAWDWWWAIDNVKIIGVLPSSLTSYLGPGGVGAIDGTSNLSAWYYPKNIRNSSNALPSDGETVNTWLDASGFNKTATNSGTATYENDGASAINGNAIMSASTLNRQFVTASSITAKTVIVVNNPGTRNNFEGVVGFNGDKGIRRPNGTDNIWQSPVAEANNDTWSTTTGDSYINGSTSNNGTHNNSLHFVSQTRPTTYSNAFYLGGYFPNRSFTGIISEVILYDTDLNLAEKIIVDNYLSAKYNISLVANDFYDEDTTGEDFDYKVAGIGQATDGSKHTDSQGTGIVRINTPSDLGNDEFLFWGENLIDANYTFSTSSDYKERLDAKWRISKRNNLGTVSLSLNASDIDLSGYNCGDLSLIVSSSSTFSSGTTSYPLSLNAGVYSTAGVSFSDGDYFTFEYRDLIVLDGTQFYNGSGTVSGVPSNLDNCYKLLVKSTADGTLVLTEDAFVREIEIESGGVLSTVAEILLQVQNGINNNGDIRLVDGSQLVQRHATGTSLNTGSGNLHVDQTASTSSVYHSGYWSSPVRKSGTTAGVNFSINDVLKDGSVPTSATETVGEATDINFISGLDGDSSATPIEISTRWLASFNNASDWTRFVSPTSAEFSPGEAWNMKSAGARFSFKGTPNDGDYSFILDQNKFSLIGNPYPSALDAQAFINENSAEFNGILYIYNSATDNSHVRGEYTGTYSTIVSGVSVGGGRYLPIGQAFFVTRDAPGTGTLKFSNSQRTLTNLSNTATIVARNANARSENNAEKSDVNLSTLKLGFKFNVTDSEERYRQVAVAFRGLTDEYQAGFDAEMWGLQPTDLYLKVANSESPFIITGVEYFDASLSIPLAVQLDEQRDVTFSVEEKKNITSPIYLYDSDQNIYYDLTDNPQVLNLEAGVYSDRFFITFSSEVLSTEEVALSKDFRVFYNQNLKQVNIQSKSDATLSSVKLYTILGQEIENYKFNTKLKKEILLDVTHLSSAVYIVKLETNKGVFSKKIIKN
jgi:hypothetical protein